MINIGVFGNIKNFFKKDELTVTKLINLLNQGYSVLQINRQLYDIPEVRTAINFVAEKVASVPFYHIRADTEGNTTVLNDSFAYVLGIRTNKYQGPQVFWTQMITNYLAENNAFAMPEWNSSGTLNAIYPLPFTNFDFAQDENGNLVIVFDGNMNYAFYYDDIIHLQRFPTFKGGNKKQATSNYTNIVGTMQNQAVKDSTTSGRIKALLQTTAALKSVHLKKNLEEFKENFLTSENITGFGMIPGDQKLIPFEMKETLLNTSLLTEIIKQLYNYFGASYEIINNIASELQFEQFIDNTIKPIVYQIEEELTYKLFSTKELAFFNKIQGETIDLEISTLTSKTAHYKEMSYGTIMNRNEIRKRLGIARGPKFLDDFLENKNFQVAGGGNAQTATSNVAEIQKTALNGAQVTGLLEIINSVATGAIPRENGISMLTMAFQLTTEEAENIMGEVGKSFTITNQNNKEGGDINSGQ